MIPVATAAGLGVFLAAVSNIFDWPSASTFVVGGAFAIVLGLFGTPLLFLGRHQAFTTDLSTNLARQFEAELEKQQSWLLNDFFPVNTAPTSEMTLHGFRDFWQAEKQALDLDATYQAHFLPTGLKFVMLASGSETGSLNMPLILKPELQGFLPELQTKEVAASIADFAAHGSIARVGRSSRMLPESMQLEPRVA
jgi:hypothetical protein